MTWWWRASRTMTGAVVGLALLAAILLLPPVAVPYPTLFGGVESLALGAVLAVGVPAVFWRIPGRQGWEASVVPVRSTRWLDVGLLLLCPAVVAVASLFADGPRAALVPLLAATGLTLLGWVPWIRGVGALLPGAALIASLLAGRRDAVTAWWALPIADAAPSALALSGALVAVGVILQLPRWRG